MRKFILSFFIFISGCTAIAQQYHFVYIQADNKQPFYVRTNNKLISSSTSGYAIVSKLLDGNYNFEIGFPKNEFPAQSINVQVSSDAGYALKNFGEKGWGLFDLQTMQTLMGGSQTKTTTTQTDNDFANVLADVSNAPELKNAETKTAVVPKKETPAPQKETTATPKDTLSQEIKKPQSANNNTGVAMISNTTDATGRSLTYVINGDGKKDTVIVFIPFDKFAQKPSGETNTPIEQVKDEPVVTSKPKSVTPESGNEKFLDIEMVNPNTNPVNNQQLAVANNKKAEQPAPAKVSNIPSFNSDCKSVASDDDFYKLRKKMAAQKDADEMTSQAKKIFKSKCFTTEQIKNLGALYLEESNKYDFYQTAYPYVSDPQIFPTLQNELTSDYLINRFKALIHL